MAKEKEGKKAAHAGHGFKHSHVEWHHDGSATVHHQHEEGEHKDVKHAAGNLDAVHDSLQDHIGTPNPGEAEANAGESGAPAAAPTPTPGGGAPLPGMGA